MHILSLIATGFSKNKKEIMEFASNTFYAVNNPLSHIERDVDYTLKLLFDAGLIEEQFNELFATDFGKRVSDLYIDPQSAITMKESLEYAEKHGIGGDSLSYLQVVCSTPDMYSLYLRGNELALFEEEIKNNEEMLLQTVPKNDPSDFERFAESYKTAKLLLYWMNERDESELKATYNVDPGDIYNKVDTASWLINAMKQIAIMFDYDDKYKLGELSIRMDHGVKKELLPLIRMRGIGRKRARSLFNEGLKSEEQVKKTPPEILMNIKNIGPKIAKRISDIEYGNYKEPVKEETSDVEKSHVGQSANENGETGQTSLVNF